MFVTRSISITNNLATMPIRTAFAMAWRLMGKTRTDSAELSVAEAAASLRVLSSDGATGMISELFRMIPLEPQKYCINHIKRHN